MKNFDRTKIVGRLSKGLADLSIQLDQEQQEKLIDYLFLLNKWNAVYNLTAVREPEKMVVQHLLDSLALAPDIKDAKHVLDVGSGGGLPGMVLAIACPETKFSLIDKVQKKGAFLNQVKAELGLLNVSVYTGSVESLEVDQLFDVITSRAFSDLKNFINLSSHLLGQGGSFIAMKGTVPLEEMEALPDGYVIEAVNPVLVPGLDAQRHLLFIKREQRI